MWGFTGYFIGRCWDNKDELNNLRLQNSFLHQYKIQFIKHYDECHSDSVHKFCFKLGDNR